jgi:hypothetical protein
VTDAPNASGRDPAEATGGATPGDEGPGSRFGWPRAILETLIVVVVGVAALVYGPNLILTRLHGLSRGGRVALATVWFSVFFVVLAWSLRRLQRRHVI